MHAALADHSVFGTCTTVLDLLVELLESEHALRGFGRVDREPENVRLALTIEATARGVSSEVPDSRREGRPAPSAR